MMSIAYTIGRIILPVYFIVAGVQKLMSVQAIATLLKDNNIPIPDQIANLLPSGTPPYEALGYFIGAVEVICGLMIMVGLKARWGALVLVIYSACAIFFVHHFWDMTGPAQMQVQELALLNLTAIGGLLLLVAGGSAPNGLNRN